MEIFSKEDRRDLLRVRLAEHPLTKAKERITLTRALEADDRLLGINQKRKESSEDIIYKSRFVDEGKEYTDEEETYRSWLMSHLWDKHEFMESFSFTYSLDSHTTKYLEQQYKRYYKSRPKKTYPALTKEGKIISLLKTIWWWIKNPWGIRLN